MRVTSISHPAAHFKDGLGDIEMWNLNRIVVLAGPNGSGKTRLITRVLLGGRRRGPNSTGMSFKGNEIQAVEFVAKHQDLRNPAKMQPAQMISSAEQAKKPGFNGLGESALAYIQRVQNHWWNSTHPNYPDTDESRAESLEAYESLCSLIQAVISENLNRDLDGNATLFGKEIAEAKLSDGQCALLKWCIALHAQKTHLNDIILLMDEPENHLHAESLVATVDRIVDTNPNGQVWIATHSVPLIASLYKSHSSDMSLYFMDNGEVHFASERPEKVLHSLMGGEENIEALREFIDLPEVFATNRYAAQCLIEPEVVADEQSNDPQAQIVDTEAFDEQKAMKLLDFGCGKGRLLSSLLAIHGSDLQQRLDYIGWDLSDRNRSLCNQVIDKAYEDSTGRWYCDRQLLAQDHPGGQFDYAVLCNVLHEINPMKWVEIFGETSVISQNLSDDGTVLIIEDYLMPKGEYAHPFGFVVLDTEALHKLFDAGTGANEIKVHSERGGRIKGHAIPKHLLGNVSQESVRNAIKLAKQNAKDEIRKLRDAAEHDFKSGRAHGFWIQQYANTTLALE